MKVDIITSEMKTVGEDALITTGTGHPEETLDLKVIGIETKEIPVIDVIETGMTGKIKVQIDITETCIGVYTISPVAETIAVINIRYDAGFIGSLMKLK